jgi:sensor histidine kinase YesM
VNKSKRQRRLEAAFLDRQFQFWGFQAVGWLGLAILTYVSLTYLYGPSDWPYILHPFVQSLLGILISWPMRPIFRWLWDKGPVLRLATIALSVLLFSFVWTVVRLWTFVLMTQEEKSFLPEFGGWYFPGVLVFAGWAALYHGIKFYHLLQEEHAELLRVAEEKKAAELKHSRAEAVAQDAQLKMLRYQLNPHFLFNTMNAIASLVNSNNGDRACTVIDKLSTFMRRSLDSDPLTPVTVSKEIETLKLYLEIEQVRFADRLQLEFEIDEEASRLLVPSLLLQPIAENAIKHAIAPLVGGGTIRIKASVLDEQLELIVEDTGPGIAGLGENELPTNGVGLRNTWERLTTIFGDEFSVRLEPASPSGLRVRLRLPARERSIAPDLSELLRSYA